MRLWSLHPSYLDRQGLLALWREGLLAQKVLAGKPKGYRQHPQLLRFRETTDPLTAIGKYLSCIAEEATRRGYQFDTAKILKVCDVELISVTRGQLTYERKHLLGKLRIRNKALYLELLKRKQALLPHPVFLPVKGEVHDWEKD
jgi:hypothetical protein